MCIDVDLPEKEEQEEDDGECTPRGGKDAIPAGCAVYYDGCNLFYPDKLSGKIIKCTSETCQEYLTAECLETFGDYNYYPWPFLEE